MSKNVPLMTNMVLRELMAASVAASVADLVALAVSMVVLALVVLKISSQASLVAVEACVIQMRHVKVMIFNTV